MSTAQSLWVELLAVPPLRLTNLTQDNRRDDLERNLEVWCEQILTKEFHDPMIQRRIIQLMVTFSTTALDSRADLMLKILEHVSSFI